jgi:hypothetical protein
MALPRQTLILVGAFAVTRAMAGAGAALLMGHRLSEQQRKRVGWALVTIGALSTLPMARRIFGSGEHLPYGA